MDRPAPRPEPNRDWALPRDLRDALDHLPDDAPVVVEFEETLWLRNANEAFLDHVQPRFLVALVTQFIAIVGPWRWTGRNDSAYRDWLRVLLIVILAPWSVWTWRRRAQELGPRYVNEPLLRRLKEFERGRVRVATFGFGFIVQPLLRVIEPDFALAAASRLSDAPRFWRGGKRAAVSVAAQTEHRPLVITNDESLADGEKGDIDVHVLRHPHAKFKVGALAPLMPFGYLKLVKRPKEKYFTRGVLGYDFVVVLLAFALVSPTPVATAISLFLFVLAFFCAYEIGYYENDTIGARYEEKPTVAPEFATIGTHFDPKAAWICAVALAAAGAVVGAGSSRMAGWGLGYWQVVLAIWVAFIGVLLLTRGLFHVFNIIETRGRIAPMLGLQLVRVLGYGMIFATSAAGAFFCIAHALARWVPYAVYRFGGERKEMPAHLVCLMLFATFSVGLLIAAGSAAATWHMGVIMLYVTARALPDMMRFAPHLRPLRKIREEVAASTEADGERGERVLVEKVAATPSGSPMRSAGMDIVHSREN